tara:strand:- start:1328 stop:1747 length:420 start_codon:yes stop_codon:yes gene_type:complete
MSEPASPGVLRVKTETFKDIRDLLTSNRKIQAIKLLRSELSISLKEAKFAIDRLQAEMGGTATGLDYSHAKKLLTGPAVLNVTLDYGDGPVELDVEGMQLRALTELQTIGIESCNHMLHLVDVFKAISDGHQVYIRKSY